MDKEKLNKELKEIDEKYNIKKIELENSSEFKKLKILKSDLSMELIKLEKELSSLRRKAHKKYSLRYSACGRYIKPCVKKGIKKGLGLTNISVIDEHRLFKIITELKKRDLKKTNFESLEKKRRIIIFKRREYEIEIENLKKKVLNPFFLQKKKIRDKLNSKEILRIKKLEEKKEEFKVKIKNLPQFIDKISDEVNKELILEKL